MDEFYVFFVILLTVVLFCFPVFLCCCCLLKCLLDCNKPIAELTDFTRQLGDQISQRNKNLPQEMRDLENGQAEKRNGSEILFPLQIPELQKLIDEKEGSRGPAQIDPITS